MLLFGVGAAAVLTAMSWTTWHVLRLERVERSARAEAQLQERLRLVLWRMDSSVSEILGAEAARPYFEYRSFYAAARPYREMFTNTAADEPLVASPLLSGASRFVKLHFQRSRDGELTSPQAPAEPFRRLALALDRSPTSLLAAEQRLDELRAILRDVGGRPLSRVGEKTERSDAEAAVAAEADTTADAQGGGPTQSSSAAASPSAAGATDYEARQRIAALAQNVAQLRNRGSAGSTSSPSDKSGDALTVAAPSSNQPALLPPPYLNGETMVADTKEAAEPARSSRTLSDQASAQTIDPATVDRTDAVDLGVFAPAWVSGRDGRPELLIVRTLRARDRVMEQGLWMDWDAMRQWLLSSAGDLLPNASLVPTQSDVGRTASLSQADAASLGRRLASIPAELVPGTLAMATPAAPWSPTHTTLVLCWIGVAGAIAGIAMALRAAQELASRRGQFVTAVTHELRTPLTTFCMYSQMLADGMVSSDDVRREYLATLKSESQRLARIVENVLEYARLGRARTKTTPIRLDELVRRIAPPLRQRAEQAGMELALSITGEPGVTPFVAADPSTIERVLFNLVDNACKYAADSEIRRIEVNVTHGARDAAFLVRDFGPGIPDYEQGRVFRPFFRSERHAHGSTPGLGLGLALAMGLARELNGRLELDETITPGAAFRLTIPVSGW